MGQIVKRGLCQYGSRSFPVIITQEPFRPGTGDYEDPPELANDRMAACYAVWYEDLRKRGNYPTGGGCFDTLTEAVRSVEADPCFIHWET